MNKPRALLSVYDKSGLVGLARGLVDLGWELLSTSGTWEVLSDAGVLATEVAEVTGTPEMLGGRVKSLHPVIHGAILADRSDHSHMEDLKTQGITPIDLVVVNLYPFSESQNIEMIDVGGSTMLRAAAKNHTHVGVVVDPRDYSLLLDELQSQNRLSDETRLSLACRALEHSVSYDNAIMTWFKTGLSTSDVDPSQGLEKLPTNLHFALEKTDELRYGENPHQIGARYKWSLNRSGWWDEVIVHGGKAMSYLNVVDAEAAWRLVHELGEEPAAVVVKHANPCGVALAPSIGEAWGLAHACDPTSAFGGVVAVNHPLPMAVAKSLAELFIEVVLAPSYEVPALETLQGRSNLRILEAPPPGELILDLRTIDGGVLVQTPDRVEDDPLQWEVVTEREPSHAEWVDLRVAWKVAARVVSNAVVLVSNRQTVGIGAGQPNRRDAAKLAAEKADGRGDGGVCASDAFFPFPDGLEVVIDAGVTAVVQPGGSVRDKDAIAVANASGVAMVFTGKRHFHH